MTYSDCFTNQQLHHALAKAVAERDEARAAAISRRYTCRECGRKGRHSKQNRGAQPICPPCDFSRLFGSGRPEDWEGFDEAVEGWRESPVATAAIDRLATIASEAFGPLPVQSAEENLTAIEQGIHQLRMDNEKLERERDNLEDQRDFAMSEMERLKEERDQARSLADAAAWEADRLYGQLWRARDRAWKLARERNYWKRECLEQCQLLAMGADREERLARERDEAKADAKQGTLKVGAVKAAWAEACRERDEARKIAEAAAFESRRLRALGLEKISNLKFQISNLKSP